MTKILFSILLFLFSMNTAKAVESQIILVQSEAYLVTLDENYDVLQVIERIPDYFQNHSSHEEILAEQIRINDNNGAYGCHDMLIDDEQPYSDGSIICPSVEPLFDIAMHDAVELSAMYYRIDPRYKGFLG